MNRPRRRAAARRRIDRSLPTAALRRMRHHRAEDAEHSCRDQRDLHQRNSYDRPGGIAPGSPGRRLWAAPGANTRTASTRRMVMAPFGCSDTAISIGSWERPAAEALPGRALGRTATGSDVYADDRDAASRGAGFCIGMSGTAPHRISNWEFAVTGVAGQCIPTVAWILLAYTVTTGICGLRAVRCTRILLAFFTWLTFSTCQRHERPRSDAGTCG